MKIMLLLFIAVFSVGTMRADGLMALLVKARGPSNGRILYLMNTGSEDIPLTSVSLSGTPSEGSGISVPTVREYIDLGPGRQIPANGVLSGILLKRFDAAEFAGKIEVTIKTADKSLRIEKVIVEKSEQ